jgi:predicted methyltransferase
VARRVDFYRRVSQALKQGGRMAIIDSPPDAHAVRQQAGQHLTAAQAASEAEEAGFRLVKEPKFLPRQYFLIFERTGEGPK